MNSPSRRGLFGLLAGAAVAPLIPWEDGVALWSASHPIADFTTDNLLVKATERIAYGWFDPRAMASVYGSEST